MRHCGLVKQACRPLLLGSIHLCNIVIGGEGAPSGPVATVRIVLGVCMCGNAFVSLCSREGNCVTAYHLLSQSLKVLQVSVTLIVMCVMCIQRQDRGDEQCFKLKTPLLP